MATTGPARSLLLLGLYCLCLCSGSRLCSSSQEEGLTGGGYRVTAVAVDEGARRLRAEAVAAGGASTGDVERLDLYARKDDHTNCCWQKPGKGDFKINVDASFSPASGDATVGIIVRDFQGMATMAASVPIGRCRDAEEAEACAIREGLKMGLELNIVPVAVESDCANAVAAANNPSACTSAIWSIFKDVEALHARIPSCKIIKIDRLCNKAAHELAAVARTSGASNVWLAPLPAFVLDLCIKDACTNVFV